MTTEVENVTQTGAPSLKKSKSILNLKHFPLDGINDFAVQLFNKIIEHSRKGTPEPGTSSLPNLLVSPLAIAGSLTVLLDATTGTTKQQIENVLRLTDEETQRTLLKSFRSAITDNINTLFFLANILVCDKNVNFNEKFVKRFEERYKSNLRKENFSNGAAEVVNTVNQWIAENFHNTIPEAICKTNLQPNDNCFLVNAVFFRGFWDRVFPKDRTIIKPFYITPSISQDVKMMTRVGDYNCLHKDDFSCVSIPYQGINQTTIMFFIPTDIQGLDALLAKLSSSMIEKCVQSLILTPDVRVTIPRLHLNIQTLEMKPILEKMGIVDFFNDSCEMPGLTKDKVSVREFYHKSVVDFVEEGYNAAQQDDVPEGVDSPAGQRPQNKLFVADRPFLFTVYNCKRHLIQFLGIVTDVAVTSVAGSPHIRSPDEPEKIADKQPSSAAVSKPEENLPSATSEAVDSAQTKVSDNTFKPGSKTSLPSQLLPTESAGKSISKLIVSGNEPVSSSAAEPDKQSRVSKLSKKLESPQSASTLKDQPSMAIDEVAKKESTPGIQPTDQQAAPVSKSSKISTSSSNEAKKNASGSSVLQQPASDPPIGTSNEAEKAPVISASKQQIGNDLNPNVNADLGNNAEKQSNKADKQSIKTDKMSLKGDKLSLKGDKPSLKDDKQSIKTDKRSIKTNKSAKDEKRSVADEKRSVGGHTKASADKQSISPDAADAKKLPEKQSTVLPSDTRLESSDETVKKEEKISLHHSGTGETTAKKEDAGPEGVASSNAASNMSTPAGSAEPEGAPLPPQEAAPVAAPNDAVTTAPPLDVGSGTPPSDTAATVPPPDPSPAVPVGGAATAPQDEGQSATGGTPASETPVVPPIEGGQPPSDVAPPQ